MTLLAMFQEAVTSDPVPAAQLLALSEAFTLLFVVMGPPLKTPAVYFARMQAFDAATRRSLAFKTFFLATLTVLIGGFVGLFLQHKWQISMPAMLIAGGLIFLLVSLRTVLEQYTPEPAIRPIPDGAAPTTQRAPSAFELAIPMIVTPYGLAGFIVLLASSHSTGRTIGVVVVVVLVMILHLLAMLFAGPVMRGIGPVPFKIFGTIIGSLTVALSVQMMIYGGRLLLAAAPVVIP
jgi:multiple antibiotic resistance protein